MSTPLDVPVPMDDNFVVVEEDGRLVDYELKSNHDAMTVPLVVYVSGKRHIVGEATIHGFEISAAIDYPVDDEVMDLLAGRPEEAQFSLGFSKGPNPFRIPSDSELSQPRYNINQAPNPTRW